MYPFNTAEFWYGFGSSILIMAACLVLHALVVDHFTKK